MHNAWDGLLPRRKVRKDGRERDFQKSKLYKCESVLEPFQESLSTVKDVERFAEKVWKSKKVQKLFPLAVKSGIPLVKDGRGTRVARGGAYWINIPMWARNTRVVLHELAHTVTIRTYGQKVAGHGWQYCLVYLKLVRIMQGREKFELLKQSMKKHRVRFRAPRLRKPMSEEERQRRLVILAQARAKWATQKLAAKEQS